MKTVYLEWVDSTSHSGNRWEDKERVIRHSGVSRCKTIGFVLKEDADQITIINSIDTKYDNVSGDMTIPKCSIRKRRVVSWKK